MGIVIKYKKKTRDCDRTYEIEKIQFIVHDTRIIFTIMDKKYFT